MTNNTDNIWQKFGDELKAFVVTKVHDTSTADDIIQDVFIKIHRSIDKLNDDTKVQSWVYQITRNAIMDYFRETKKQQKNLPYLLPQEEESSENIMTQALLNMINMMDELPKDYCEALCLTELEGMSQKVYANKIGISYSNAKSRVQRARKKLKDMLMSCCHYQFDKYGSVLGIYPSNCCLCNSEKHCP